MSAEPAMQAFPIAAASLWPTPGHPTTLLGIMKRFDPMVMLLLGNNLGQAAQAWKQFDELRRLLGPKATTAAAVALTPRQHDTLRALATRLAAAGLKMSAAGVERVRCATTQAEHAACAAALNHRLEDELDSLVCFQIAPEHAAAFGSDHPFGEDVDDAFPSTLRDAREAARCIALDRYTAAVFHLMRVVEVGLRALASTLKLKINTPTPTWNSYVTAIDAAQKPKPGKPKSARQRGVESFSSAAAAHIGHISRAWRNPVVHDIDTFYSGEDAEQVFVHIRALMRHLATRCRE